MIEIKEVEAIKKPALLTAIRANIKFWDWAAMHGSKLWNKTIEFGYKPALFSVYERATNSDTSLIWK